MNKTKLKQIIKHFGSQGKLAEVLGVTPQSVSLWHTGKLEVPRYFLLRIEELTNGKFGLEEMLKKKDAKYLKGRYG